MKSYFYKTNLQIIPAVSKHIYTFRRVTWSKSLLYIPNLCNAVYTPQYQVRLQFFTLKTTYNNNNNKVYIMCYKVNYYSLLSTPSTFLPADYDRVCSPPFPGGLLTRQVSTWREKFQTQNIIRVYLTRLFSYFYFSALFSTTRLQRAVTF